MVQAQGSSTDQEWTDDRRLDAELRSVETAHDAEAAGAIQDADAEMKVVTTAHDAEVAEMVDYADAEYDSARDADGRRSPQGQSV